MGIIEIMILFNNNNEILFFIVREIEKKVSF